MDSVSGHINYQRRRSRACRMAGFCFKLFSSARTPKLYQSFLTERPAKTGAPVVTFNLSACVPITLLRRNAAYRTTFGPHKNVINMAIISAHWPVVIVQCAWLCFCVRMRDSRQSASRMAFNNTCRALKALERCMYEKRLFFILCKPLKIICFIEKVKRCMHMAVYRSNMKLLLSSPSPLEVDPLYLSKLPLNYNINNNYDDNNNSNTINNVKRNK